MAHGLVVCIAMGWLYVLPWVGCMYCHGLCGLVICIVMVFVGWLYVYRLLVTCVAR